jgi:hypothetical protein
MVYHISIRRSIVHISISQSLNHGGNAFHFFVSLRMVLKPL